jgi:hypothetical protein
MWRSKLQTVVAQSTAEAEFVAASMAVKEIMWLLKLLWGARVGPRPISVYCDDKSALKLMRTECNVVCGVRPSILICSIG